LTGADPGPTVKNVKVNKTIRRIAQLKTEPEQLERVARDIAVAVARGEREELKEVGRALATYAPTVKKAEHDDHNYRAGFAAALGTLLAAYEVSFERKDARRVAMEAVSSDTSKAVVVALARQPATNAELARAIGVTPGATSKILNALREAGLARILGGHPLPERGARKTHALTPMGSWVADTLTGEVTDATESARTATKQQAS